MLIPNASFITGAFLIAEPLVDCKRTSVAVLGDGSAADAGLPGVEFPIVFTLINDALELEVAAKFLRCFL